VSRRFDCFVGIDWSGDKKIWQKGLKVAVATPGKKAPEIQVGPGLRGRWSRTEVTKWIASFVRAQRALIGIDFAFGFPSVEKLLEGTILDWHYVENLCADDENYYGGKFFRVAGAPHSVLINSPWLPRVHYSAHHLRITELEAKRIKGATPQCIFNAVGGAQVGPSSISGMRCLLHLRKEHSRTISIWPFDEIDDAKSVIVEMFPRYFALSRSIDPNLADHAILNYALERFGSDPVVTAPASEDEGDAILSAAALRALSDDNSLFNLPDLSIRNEGWIFGVPTGGVS